jgi:hypothetical protein
MESVSMLIRRLHYDVFRPESMKSVAGWCPSVLLTETFRGSCSQYSIDLFYYNHHDVLPAASVTVRHCLRRVTFKAQ